MNSLEQAREIAAQCWCDKETAHIVIDPLITEAFAKRLAIWIDSFHNQQKVIDFLLESRVDAQ